MPFAMALIAEHPRSALANDHQVQPGIIPIPARGGEAFIILGGLFGLGHGNPCYTSDYTLDAYCADASGLARAEKAIIIVL